MIVKVRSTGGTAAAEYSSDTTQWGELLDEIKTKVSLDGKKIMATTEEGEVIDYTDEIGDRDATLPITGTLTIMLVTTKVKSGY